MSWVSSSIDIFAEYVDKQSKTRTQQTNLSGQETETLTPLKKGSAFYFNPNLYVNIVIIF